ncbi:MAG: hypothetical protein M3024_16410, partial [Candidatus Dormibacteraeota bacterium]|nr:hypothetical protein [Candidatus Dormibacteraeota bacterium]
DGDAREIADLQMQLDILKVIYAQALHLFQTGREADARMGEEVAASLASNLAFRGYGAWTLDNVYAFVYERAVELPSEGHGSFVGEIQDTNFAALLAS